MQSSATPDRSHRRSVSVVLALLLATVGAGLVAGSAAASPLTGRQSAVASPYLRAPATMHRVGDRGLRAGLVRNSVLTGNWSGQVATGSSPFTMVQGNWTVPTIAASVPETDSATWIGIDGTQASSLIQTGTSQVSQYGHTQYQAWYELLPNGPVYTSNTVAPGDAMHAVITKTGLNVWSVQLDDLTRSWQFLNTVPYSTPGLSAEWIEEAPTLVDQSGSSFQSTLSDFGTVTFSGMATSGPAVASFEAVVMADVAGTAIAAYARTYVPGSGTFVVYCGAPPTDNTGYDLVGSDGGVFVFGGGFHGSLPGLGVHVDDITGIVPTASDTGYFLVGADGGVFAFNAPFANSLPGIGVHVNNIVGIVPTLDDRGYFLVGRDGGVFSFNAPFENSLPGLGIHVNDIVGIAATADNKGYWLVGSDGSVYALGDAAFSGNGAPGAVGITVTPTGAGYWIVGADGTVTPRGDAIGFGGLPDLGVSVNDVVGIVVSSDGFGYNLFGRDGGVFSFGDAGNLGSLPGLGVHVANVVGAVPT